MEQSEDNASNADGADAKDDASRDRQKHPPLQNYKVEIAMITKQNNLREASEPPDTHGGSWSRTGH